MPRYAAFLRGINVTGTRVSKDDLCAGQHRQSRPPIGADDAFDSMLLLVLDGRLDPAPLDEILRRGGRQHFDIAVGLGGPTGSEAERNARFGAVVDDNQIGAHALVPPCAGGTLLESGAQRKRNESFGRGLDPDRRIGFVPRPAKPMRR